MWSPASPVIAKGGTSFAMNTTMVGALWRQMDESLRQGVFRSLERELIARYDVDPMLVTYHMPDEVEAELGKTVLVSVSAPARNA